HNIRSLLMQPPLVGKRVLAINPSYRNGCKLAALDEHGALLDHAVIYPHGSPGGGKRGKDKKPAEQPAAPPPAAEAPAAPAPEAAPPPAPETHPLTPEM